MHLSKPISILSLLLIAGCSTLPDQVAVPCPPAPTLPPDLAEPPAKTSFRKSADELRESLKQLQESLEILR